jgi:hypothetical protein
MTPADPARTPRATLTEPLTEGKRTFLAASTPGADLAAAGWVEVELVAEGVAVSHRHDGEVPEDGRRTLTTGVTAPYRTRVVVRRPADAAASSGTVVVEWLNVSSGLDANPDWSLLAPELVRTGVAWVGVSAQVIGVEGGAVLVEAGGAGVDGGTGLKGLDPARYGTLAHPGDAFCFDIYTQVGAALRAGAPAALGDLVVEQLVAVGESQSAFALTTYVNGVHDEAWVYDGFLVHSRGRRGLELADEESGGAAPRARVDGAPERIRDDLDVPVMIVQTETDLLPVLGYAEARQEDTDMIRLWEIAGTAHADASMLGPYAAMVDCGVTINDGPHRFVARAALRHLVRWAAAGDPPPSAPRLVVDLKGGAASFPRDPDGLARGGIRLPQVEVPVRALSGEPGPVDSLMCQLLGSTHAFAPERLAELYPSAEVYLSAYEAATDAAIAAGFALPEDRAEILADAHPELLPS